MKIRKLVKSEIPMLQNFPPEDWKIDLPATLRFHFDQPYFYPAAVEADGKIIGCGNAFCHGKIGWLGHIIVIPEYRNQGIGRSITKYLMEYLTGCGCKTQLLIATEMGEGVYRSLGFRASLSYIFYKSGLEHRQDKIENVRLINNADIPFIKKMDREISGEERFGFIGRFLNNAYVYPDSDSNGLRGFYLPEFENGYIAATDSKAGLELMKVRLNEGRTSAVIPSSNREANDFIISRKFVEIRTAPKMIYGNDIEWHPEKIYNRGSGYCG
jgi:GNAT superfamily N-acetyltransferase